MRDTKSRKADVLAALEKQGQYWLATADGGRPHVIAVSAWWDGSDLVAATLGSSRTARNLERNQAATLAGGDPDDAVVIQARAVEHRAASGAPELAQGFAAAMGWDPGGMEGWVFVRFRPSRIQAFRGYAEIEGRDVMKDGRWLA